MNAALQAASIYAMETARIQKKLSIASVLLAFMAMLMSQMDAKVPTSMKIKTRITTYSEFLMLITKVY